MTVRPYLELARLSNAPTVVSNTLVGVALGAASGTEPISITNALLAGLAVLLLYAGGMALNDVCDVKRDTASGADRPIPAGRLSHRAAIVFTAITLGAGTGLLMPLGVALPYAAALLGAIVLYDVLHGRTAVAVVFMGVCRGLVYIAVAAAVASALDWSIIAPPAIALAAYIIGLTVIARIEAQAHTDARRWLGFALPLTVLPLALFLIPPAPWLATVGGIALVAGIVRAAAHAAARPPRIGDAVHGWLAAICLVDMYVLVLLDRPWLALGALACGVMTRLGHRSIVGT